ncbi:MAG: hypothetical protein WCT06_06320 [Armatimonadota bacterium]|jgi:hypothetical protein|nr:hypothetical protein [Armatimonadota bacterium]
MSPVVRRGTAPWVWVLIVLAAILLVFVIWFAIAAQSPRETVVVPGGSQETTPPTTTGPAPSQPAPAEQQPGTNVNIYVSKDHKQPNVIVVPKGGQTPQSTNNMQQVNLPGELQYDNAQWKVTRQVVAGDNTNLKDSGDSAGGRTIYVEQNAQKPYDHIYLETESGSGIFLRYNRSS